MPTCILGSPRVSGSVLAEPTVPADHQVHVKSSYRGVFSVEGRGRVLFTATERLDLEGIVAKRKRDPYAPSTTWLKIKNRAHTQMEERGDLPYPRRLFHCLWRDRVVSTKARQDHRAVR
jgi:hypothetical protein